MDTRRHSYIHSAVHNAKQINRTKYFLTFVTIFCTILSVFLIRVNLSQKGNISSFAKTIFWLLNSTSGVLIIAYPWWLTTRNSILYYKRLEFCCVSVVLVVYVLVIVRTVLAPVEHINNTDPSITSVGFRIVSLLYWVSLLVGFFIFMPFMIRRHRLFNSGRTQLALVCFVVPCVVLAICSVVLQEWIGDGFLISTSPVILIVLYYATKIAHAVFNEPEANGVEFNEAYIIIAGFVPLWLGLTLGKSLLEVINQGNVFGTLVTVMFWRVIIWIFEVMCAEIGRKATRMSDEAIFSFCAIYTGAVYAEFIFLSVEFNSSEFYLLLLLEFLTIVFWQGGRIIDIQQWIVQYLPSNWFITQKFKAGWLVVIGEMPGEIADRCSHFSGTTNIPPDVALSLIRSRAVVVQITWAQNDIKMASELQSLACATFAVAADMVFSTFDIGVDFITVPSKQELFYIYLVNLCVIIIAQAVAQYEIKSKVKSLKADVNRVVQSITSKKRISNDKMKQLSTLSRSRERGGSAASLVSGSGLNTLFRHESTETVDEDKDDSTQYNPLASLRDNKPKQPKKRSQRRSSIIDMFESAISTVKDQVVDTAADDNDHFLDLQDILDITEEINDDGAVYATRGRKASTASSSRRRCSTLDSNGASSTLKHTHPAMDDFDFGDVSSILECKNLNEGYMEMQQHGASSFYRKYFILTPEMLMYYSKESDVSEHVAAIQGKIFVGDIVRVLQDVSTQLNFSIVMENSTYNFKAYTDTEADVWFNILSQVVNANHKVGDIDVSSIGDSIVDRKRQNITNYRRSSVGGIPSVVNSLLYPSESKLPTKYGYLEKYNNLFWQKRYFKLEHPGVLSWYGSEKDARSDTELKNYLRMEKVLSVCQLDEDSCCFDIDVRGRTFHLKAFSTGLATEWCECITAWSKFMFLRNGKRGSSQRSNYCPDDNGSLARHRTDTTVSALTDASSSVKQTSDVESNCKRSTLGIAARSTPEKLQGQVMIKAGLFSLSKWKLCSATVVSPGVLSVTKLESPHSLLESINLWEVLSIEVAESEEDFEYCLDIDMKGRVLVMNFETSVLRDNWVKCLSAWADTESLDLRIVLDGEGDGNGAVVDRKVKRRASFFDLTMDKLRQHNDVVRGRDGNGDYNRINSISTSNSSHQDIAYQKVPFSIADEENNVDVKTISCNVGPLETDSIETSPADEGGLLLGTTEHVPGIAYPISHHHPVESSVLETTTTSSSLARFFKRLSVSNDDEEEAPDVVAKTRKSLLSNILGSKLSTGKSMQLPENDIENISDDENEDKVGELVTRGTSGSVFQSEDQFVAKVCERSLIRRTTHLPSAWVGGASADKGKQRRRMSIGKTSQQSTGKSIGDGIAGDDVSRTRTESTCADESFIERNTNADQDDFVNKLKTRSYHELNREFWHRHRWYLTAVVCYVTMHVLSVTSYMISETSFEKE